MSNEIEEALKSIQGSLYRYRAGQVKSQCDLLSQMIQIEAALSTQKESWAGREITRFKGMFWKNPADEEDSGGSKRSAATANPPPASPTQKDLDEIVRQNSSTGGILGAKTSKKDIDKSLQDIGISREESSKNPKKVIDALYDSDFYKSQEGVKDAVSGDNGEGKDIFDSITSAFSSAMDWGSGKIESAGDALSAGLGAARDLAESAYEEAKANGDAFGEMAAIAGAAVVRAPLANSKDAGDLIMGEIKAAFADTKARYQAKRDNREATGDTHFASPDEVEKLESSIGKTEKSMQETINANIAKNQKKAAVLKEKNPTQKTLKEKAQAEVEDLTNKNAALEETSKKQEAKIERMKSDYDQVSKQRDSYANAVNALSANQDKLVGQLGEKNKEIQKKEQKVETLQSEVDSVMSDLQNEKIGREDAERVVQKSQQALMQAISDVDTAFAEADSYKEQMNKNYDMAEKAKKDHEDKMNALRSRFEETYPDWEDDIQQTSLSNSDVKEMVDKKESKKKDKTRQEAIDKMRKELESAEKDLEQTRRRKEARKQRAKFFEDMKRNIFGG